MRCPREVLPAANAEQFQRDDLLIEHRHQPAHRTNEHFPALAPVHILRPVERGDFLGKSLGKNLGGGAAFPRDRGRQVFALGSADFLQLADIHADFLGKRMRCRSRLPILICDLRGRPVHLLGNVRLRGGNAGSQNGQTARRVEMRNRSGWFEALALQQRVQAFAQLARSGVNHPRRNFFASDFK